MPLQIWGMGRNAAFRRYLHDREWLLRTTEHILIEQRTGSAGRLLGTAMMIGKHTLHTALALAILAMTTVALPATASAEERYSDADSGFLRVASRVTQPVGIILENVVFKPFTAFLSWSDPTLVRTERVRHPRICSGLRPHRACIRGN